MNGRFGLSVALRDNAGIPRVRRARSRVILLAFFLWWSGSAGATPPVAELRIGEHVLQLEIVATPTERARGLMYRRAMPPDQGMLFVWERDARQAMWMRNTYLPLSVAFIDQAFRIVNIADMEPLTTRLHHSSAPIRYAIEVHQGWFEEHGIRAGMQLVDLQRVIAELDLP